MITGTQLDYMVTDLEVSQQTCSVLNCNLSDHFGHFFEFMVQCNSGGGPRGERCSRRNLSRKNLQNLEEMLLNRDWSEVYSAGAGNAFEIFCTTKDLKSVLLLLPKTT